MEIGTAVLKYIIFNPFFTSKKILIFILNHQTPAILPQNEAI